VEIKWPNDVLLDGLKTSGILMELSAEATRVARRRCERHDKQEKREEETSYEPLRGMYLPKKSNSCGITFSWMSSGW